MKFKLLTLFPEMLEAMLSASILGRARRAGAIETEVIDIRPFSRSKHKNTDDTPYGGGAGMVMTPQPALDAIRSACGENFRGRRIYLSPKGERFTQKKAEELAKEEGLVLFCGHYEGLDQRVIDLAIDEEISVGDYVLTGGELGALIVTDAVARLLPGVLGSDESSVDESFSGGLLEYPHYTRPREIRGLSVPEVLLNGDQKLIDRWRRDEALRLTYARRPEMLTTALLDKDDRALLRRLRSRSPKTRVYVLSKDAEKARRIRARLVEECPDRLSFTRPEDCECLLCLDADSALPLYGARVFLPRLLTESEKEEARAKGILAFGFSPYAFDPFVLRVSGDEGIKQAAIGGLGIMDFACVAARILPLRTAKPHRVDWGKSRRAFRTEAGAPRVSVDYRDGDAEQAELISESSAFLRAVLGFALEGTFPLDPGCVRDAERILRCFGAEVVY